MMINTAVLVALIAVLTIFCGNTNAFIVGVGRPAEIRGPATFGGSSLLLFSTASDASDTNMPAAAPVEKVHILPNIDAVGSEIRKIVREAAAAAIAERGAFSLAIPGGSILKMLVGTGTGGDEDGDDSWTAKTTVAYVNHKCVAMDDAQLATHAKASNLFFGDWSKDCNIITMDGTDDGDKEAQAYESKLRSLSTAVLPVENGTPVFDLALIGVGDDGHVGSLYPDREEVLVGTDGPWVLPVAMKQPPSITLSLPVMQSAKQVVIAAGGVSDKYPQGKSAGMKRAIADETETVQSFPAVGLRSCATWVLDEAAASELGDSYTTSS